MQNCLVYPTTLTHINVLICDAVNIDHAVFLLGMNVGLMCQYYIKLCGDYLIVALLQQPHSYGAANPFPWMTLISHITVRPTPFLG
jgi:hypothetical protein